MPANLPLDTTTPDFKDTVMGGGGMYAQGSIIIANNPVSIEIQSGPEIGTLHTEIYPYVSPSIIPIQAPVVGERVNQVRFRDYIPGQHAAVAGWMLEEVLAGLGPATAFAGTITPSGGVTQTPNTLQSSLSLWRNVAQSIPHNTETNVIWTNVVQSSGSANADYTWNGAERITVNTTGVYLFCYDVLFVNGINTRYAWIFNSGSGVGKRWGYTSTPANNQGLDDGISGSVVIPVNAGQFLSLLAYQNSGAALNLSVDINAGSYPSWSISKLF